MYLSEREGEKMVKRRVQKLCPSSKPIWAHWVQFLRDNRSQASLEAMRDLLFLDRPGRTATSYG